MSSGLRKRKRLKIELSEAQKPLFAYKGQDKGKQTDSLVWLKNLSTTGRNSDWHGEKHAVPFSKHQHPFS